MKEYIVKSIEEELGEELYVVKVPKKIPKEKVLEVFKVAAKYADHNFVWDVEGSKVMDREHGEMTDAELTETYDEHYLWMYKFKCKNGCSNQEMFFTYLKEFYGWESEDLQYDFDFEW